MASPRVASPHHHDSLPWPSTVSHAGAAGEAPCPKKPTHGQNCSDVARRTKWITHHVAGHRRTATTDLRVLVAAPSPNTNCPARTSTHTSTSRHGARRGRCSSRPRKPAQQPPDCSLRTSPSLDPASGTCRSAGLQSPRRIFAGASAAVAASDWSRVGNQLRRITPGSHLSTPSCSSTHALDQCKLQRHSRDRYRSIDPG